MISHFFFLSFSKKIFSFDIVSTEKLKGNLYSGYNQSSSNDKNQIDTYITFTS